jgi:hypothetical protein
MQGKRDTRTQKPQARTPHINLEPEKMLKDPPHTHTPTRIRTIPTSRTNTPTPTHLNQQQVIGIQQLAASTVSHHLMAALQAL